MPGVVAISIPPVALCVVSIVMSSEVTKYAALFAIGIGLVYYRWQCRTSSAHEPEIVPTL